MKTTTTMKLSKRTLDILKNFSTINQNLYIEPGNRLYTINTQLNVVAEAFVEENFDSTICIYELTKFLGVVSLFDSPEFEFDEKSTTIHGNNNSQVKFYFCESKVIEKFMKNYGKLPKQNKNMYSFNITQRQIDELIRAASVLQIKSICVSKCEDGGVNVSVIDRENTTANSYTVNIPDAIVDEDAEDVFIQISLLAIMSGSYHVNIDNGNTTKWTNKDIDLKYYIAKDINKD